MPEYRERPEAKENFDRAMKSLFQSPTYTPQKKQGKTPTLRKTPTSRQELERFHSCRPRPCLRHVWRITLTRQFAVRQSVSRNSTHCLSEFHRIGQLSSHRILAI